MVARTRYAPDRGLTVRMGLTMFLLGLVFVAFVAAIIGISAAVHASDGAIVFFAVVLGGGLAIGSFFYSDKIALSTAGAQLVTPQQAPELHGIVDRDRERNREAGPLAFAHGARVLDAHRRLDLIDRERVRIIFRRHVLRPAERHRHLAGSCAAIPHVINGRHFDAVAR